MASADPALHQTEQHVTNLGGRLNWLRAGVLGANDGIVSVAGILAGVAGATGNLTTILTAGVAGAVAGAFSMAGGEYVSVNTQRDTEEAALRRERWELEHLPEQEEAELATLYRQQGLSDSTARMVARELHVHGPLNAHARLELGIDPEELTSPWHAAFSSFIAFAVGSALPILAIALPRSDWRIAVCYVGTVIGLVLTGGISAHLGGAHKGPAILRNVGVGTLTMVFTYLVGVVFGTTVN